MRCNAAQLSGKPRSCRPPSMKSRRNELTTARSVGTSRQRLSSSKTSRPDAPIRADLVGTSRVEHHDLTPEECFGICDLWGQEKTVWRDYRFRATRRDALANQDVARRQAPQRNTTVNARRIALCQRARCAEALHCRYHVQVSALTGVKCVSAARHLGRAGVLGRSPDRGGWPAAATTPEPHQHFINPRWRQVMKSERHCDYPL